MAFRFGWTNLGRILDENLDEKSLRPKSGFLDELLDELFAVKTQLKMGVEMTRKHTPWPDSAPRQFQPREGRPVDLVKMAEIMFPNLTPDDRARVAAMAFDVLTESEKKGSKG
jgi:hypothetical protein